MSYVSGGRSKDSYDIRAQETAVWVRVGIDNGKRSDGALSCDNRSVFCWGGDVRAEVEIPISWWLPPTTYSGGGMA